MVFQGEKKAWRWEPASLRNEKALGRLRSAIRSQAKRGLPPAGLGSHSFRILF